MFDRDIGVNVDDDRKWLFLQKVRIDIDVRTEEFVRSISFPSVWRRAGLCARVCVLDIVKMGCVLRLSLPSALYSGGSLLSLSSFHLTKGTLPPANSSLPAYLLHIGHASLLPSARIEHVDWRCRGGD